MLLARAGAVIACGAERGREMTSMNASINTVPKRRIQKANVFWLALSHVMAVVAIPFFTWDAFAVCMIGLFLVTPFGVNLGYHRLLTHRGLKVPKWLEYTLTTVAAACGGGPPMHWVAEHRLHHCFSDKEGDPHNSREGLWHAHMAHLFYHKEFEDNEELWMKYVPDMKNDRYYLWLNKNWILAPITVAGILFAIGGLPWLMWGGFVRVVLMLHITWCVNSVSHGLGYRNYRTNDTSTNCWWVGILGAGEGWHNNHHAYPTLAKHGHKWWELDFTYMVIRGLQMVGLAWDVKVPKAAHLKKQILEEDTAGSYRAPDAKDAASVIAGAARGSAIEEGASSSN